MHMDWTSQEKRVFSRLSNPGKIQDFLDGLAYNASDRTISAREVLKRRQVRNRDPVYRWLRELALSYFPVYFNSAGI